MRTKLRDTNALRHAAEILDTIADPVVAFDRNFRCTFVNRRASELLAGDSFLELFSGDAGASFREACERAWEDRRPATFEGYSKLLDAWLEIRIYPGENGASAQWRDVTGRRREAARLSAITEGYYVLDAAWRFVELNRAAAQHFGRPAAELAGRNIWSETGARNEFVAGMFRHAVESGREVHFEAESRLNPGRWSELHAYPFNGGLEVYFHDITARKSAETALRESERRLRLAQKAGRSGSFEWDAKADVFTWSDELLDLYGFKPGEFGGTQQDWIEAVAPEDREAAGAAALKSLETGFFELEFRIRRKDTGEVRWMYGRAEVHHDSSGKPARVIGIDVDITERKRVEQALRDSQRRLAMAQSAGKTGYFELDPQTGNVLWSEQLQELYDYRPGEFDGRFETWLGRVHPDDREAAAAIAGTREDDCTLQFRILTRDGGGIRWMESRSRALLDDSGTPRSIIGFNIDITAQKKAEQRLEESDSRYRRLFDSMQEGFVIGEIISDGAGAPLDWRYVEVNPAMAGLLRRNRDEILGHTYRELFPGAPWQFWVSRFGQVALTGVPARVEGYGGGTRRHYDALVQPLGAGRFAAILTDITDRKRTEDALRESEAKYRQLFDSMQEAFFAAEIVTEAGAPVDYRFLEANPALERVTGLRRSDLIGRLVTEAMPGVDRHWIDLFGAVALSGEPDRFERYSTPLDRWFEAHAYSPRPGVFATTFRDTTERQRAEEAVRRSEARYRDLVQNATSAIVRWKTDGTITFFNEYAETFFGYRADEVAGRHVSLLVPGTDSNGTDLSRLIQEIAAAPERFATFENENICRDGRRVWMTWTNKLVPDEAGGAAEILAVGTDITERKRAEEAVRRHNTVLEGINQVFNAALGCRTAEELGRECLRVAREVTASRFGIIAEISDGMLNDIALSDAGMDECRMDLRAGREKVRGGFAIHGLYGRVAAGGEGFYTNDPSSHPDSIGTPPGHPPLRAFLGVPLKHGDKVIGIIGVGNREGGYSDQDLAALEAVAPAVVQVWLRQKAEQAVRAGEERLRQAQKMESIGLLAGGIAHDFNNLLTGVIGNASLAMEQVDQDSAALLKGVISNAGRAAHLTRQLLAYAGKGQFVVQDLDLSGFIAEMRDFLRLSLPKSVELEFDLANGLPLLSADPGQLQQLVMNLVINAGEATVETRPGRVEVSTSVRHVSEPFMDALGEEMPPDRYVCVEVADNGPGIEESARTKIFDPFFTTKFTGRGLGLAAVAGIMRALKGGITLRSAAGRGAAFTLWFHAVASQRAVLVIDDEDYVRGFIRAALEKRGYRVLEARDGQHALEMSAGGGIDAVILDVVMPVMGADEVLPELKRRNPGVPVLLTSGYSETEARRLCAAFDGTTFIQKPYTAKQIVAAVDDLLVRA